MRKAVWFASVIAILITVILLGFEPVPTAAQGPFPTPRKSLKDRITSNVNSAVTEVQQSNRSLSIRITWIDTAAWVGNGRVIAIHTAIKVVGYKNQPVYARIVFYRNNNGQPGYAIGGPKIDNVVMKLVPPYDSTEWKDATFYYSYDAFPTNTHLFIAKALIESREPNTMPYISQPMPFTVPVRID